MYIEAEVLFEDGVESENGFDVETTDGIAFTIPEGFSTRTCLIQKQALHQLCGSSYGGDLRGVFNRNERLIHQIARRLLRNLSIDATVIITATDIRSWAGHFRRTL